MSAFFSYVFLGLSLAAPIGPVNAAQMNKGIKSGFFHAWLLGLGAVTADIIYMVAVYMGVVHFLEMPFMKSFLWLFGCFVLIYTGIESMANAGKLVLEKERGGDSKFKSFLSGFLLSITNPLTILFWLGIYGSILAKTAASFGTSELVFYSFSVILGVLIWDITMASIASGFRKFLTTKILTIISIFSGLSLIGFGLYFGYEAAKLLFG